MKTVSLSGSPRENVGKKGAASLRTENRIPAVIYGGKEQVHFSIAENDELTAGERIIIGCLSRRLSSLRFVGRVPSF